MKTISELETELEKYKNWYKEMSENLHNVTITKKYGIYESDEEWQAAVDELKEYKIEYKARIDMLKWVLGR